MRAARWASLALVLTSCVASRPRPAAEYPVRVTALALDFSVQEQGTLSFALQLPPGLAAGVTVRTVAWNLTLDGNRFATGVAGPPSSLVGGAWKLEAPLVSRHVQWREGEGSLDVMLDGEVDVGPGQRLAFHERRELVVQARPLWHTGE